MNRIKGFNNFRIAERMKELACLSFSNSIKKEHKKRIENPRNSIIDWTGKVESESPKHKDPEIMVNELLKIKSFIQSNGIDQSRKDGERYDHDMLDKFESICARLNLEFDRDYFKGLKEEMGDLIAREKYRWNMPRPFQVADFMDIPYNERYQTETSESPTYPSSHAGRANLIAGVLSIMYPKNSGDFYRLADLISLSRISAGVHFFPDIEEGKRMAKKIIDLGIVKIPKQ